MTRNRGFARVDLAAVLVLVTIGAAIIAGLAPEPRGPHPMTYANLRTIGQASEAYRDDYQNYLPILLTYQRGTVARSGTSMEGWCNWVFGGKNNNGFWATRQFDVEAADRPLNPYVIPDEFFYAPPFPARLPAAHPSRATAQAPMFNDPGDLASYERNWPIPTKSINGYNDVGTSYLFNVAWWDQIPGGLPFQQRFLEGSRRIAAGEGVDPSRFVWLTTQVGDILSVHTSRSYRITNAYGDVNTEPLLFMDGHVSYERITPTVHSTSRYTFWFEP